MSATVGKSPLRTDGVAKVTGEAKYVDDLRDEEFLWGMTVRSKVARGTIKSITYDPDYEWTDIVRVDYRDVPAGGQNVVSHLTDDQPALASTEIRHMYEPIVLLACADLERLAEAAKHVFIEVEPLEGLFDFETADKSELIVYGDDNIMNHLTIAKGDVEAGFEAADLIVEGVYRTGWQEQMYIEPQGMIAVPHEDGSLTVSGSLQCPFYVLTALKKFLGVGEDKVNVVQTITGGAFGGKEDYPSMIACHVALLALKGQKPVKIVYDRAEDLAATTKRHPATMRHKTGVMRDGTLVASRVEFDLDGGAYITMSPVVLARGLIHGVGCYRVPNVFIDARVLATSTPPNGAFRGFGNPQATFGAERHMDKIAEVLGLSPLEIRRINLLKAGDTTATDQQLDLSVGGAACLDMVVEKSRYEALREEYAAFNAASEASGSPLRRGVGLSTFFHGAGFTGNGEARIMGRADVELREGGRVRIYTGSIDMGQGVNTTFPQLASTELGLGLDAVEMAVPDTSHVPDSGPTVASRTLMVVGKVVQQATRKLIAKLGEAYPGATYDPDQQAYVDADGAVVASWQDAAAAAYEAAGGPIRVEQTYEPDPNVEWDGDKYLGDAYPVYSWAADVASVEIDLDTYEIDLLDFHTAEDIGKAIHPIIVEGQLEGGTLQGIGYGTCEELHMKDGAVLNNRMTNYIIPTSLDSPEILVHLVELPFIGGPHGAKGLGELPTDGPAPAIAAAIAHATGAEVNETSFTPEKLHRALLAPKTGSVQ